MQTRIAHILGAAKEKISTVLSETKKHWKVTALFAVGVFAISFLIAPSAYAQTETLANIGTYILSMIAEALLMIAQICIKLTVFALDFFIKLAKYNGYIDAPIVILGWTMIRDIANMFFVVVLLIIAFGTILGLEQYEWKKTMVNFILAAIFINFSKMIAGLIIDVAHVFTMTFVNAIAATAGGNLINMFHLNSIVSIVSGGLGGEEVKPDIVLEVFGGAVMALIFAVLAMATMGAYLIVMVARIVVLWALIILSPLAYIMSVIPQTKSYADTWWSEFGKHVVVAPIMVFFLWLGFATLGTGSFVQADLGINFGTADAETSKALGIPVQSAATPAVSISKVSTWENMANFILAIAFLWIGIEQVQKTGVRGGEFLSNAKSFATKAAMIGSGYALGKWLAGETYDKGKSGALGAAGYVGNRIPLVGGASLKEYGSAIKSTFDRKGVLGVAGAAVAGATLGKLAPQWQGLGGMESKIKRSEYAKANEDKGPMGWLKARMWEPAERAEKRAEDWKVASERLGKTLEESYSTSSSRAGQVKLDETVRMQATLAMAEAKGKQKTEGRNKEVSEVSKMFGKMVDQEFQTRHAGTTMDKDQEKKAREKIEKDLQADSGAMATLRDQYLNSIPDKKEREKIAQFIDRDGGIKNRIRVGSDVITKKKTKAASMADAEESSLILSRSGEIAQATERDKILVAKGKSPQYVESVLAKHQKEDMDLAANSSYDRTMAKINNLKKKIRDRDPKVTDAMRDRWRNELSNLALSTNAMGSTFGNGSTAAATEGLTVPLVNSNSELDNIRAQQAKELAGILQEDVDPANLDAAFTKLKKLKGEQFDAYMRVYFDSLMKSGVDGSVNKAGLFYENYDANTGKSTFHLVDNKPAPDGKNMLEWAERKRNWATSQSKFDRIQGFSGSVDEIMTAAGKKHTIKSTVAVSRIAKMFGAVTSNRVAAVDENNIDDFNTAFDNMAETEVQALVNAMRSEAKDDDGIRALLSRTNLKSKGYAITIDNASNRPVPLF